MTLFKRFWHGHGTKILGALATVVGIAQEVANAIQAADPKHAMLWALIIAIGVATVKRGFTNGRAPNIREAIARDHEGIDEGHGA